MLIFEEDVLETYISIEREREREEEKEKMNREETKRYVYPKLHPMRA